jgi:chemotaxis protein CheY-P-specific phosphatase CheC
MCSTKPPNLFSPDAAQSVTGAVAAVAELSFFADVAPCDDASFDELAGGASSWLIATVHFREGDAAGVLSCSVPRGLARALLDAFTGRDPADPEPESEALFDLVGELSNMICGTWLTRMATAQTFTLSRPVVEISDARPRDTLPGTGSAARLIVNDMPLAVSVCAANEGAPAAVGF